MKITIVPNYHDLFDDQPELDTLLEGISSSYVLGFLAYINAQLFSKAGPSSELQIMLYFTQDLEKNKKELFFNKVSKFIENNKPENVAFFSILASLEFIHYQLLKFDDFDNKQPSPEDKFRFLKSYFLIVDKLNKKIHIEERQNHPEDFFKKHTWPLLCEQYEANHNPDFALNLIRGLTFLKYLQYDSPYDKYLQTFLSNHGKKNSWDYLKSLMDLLQLNWISPEDPIRPFFLQTVQEEKFLDNISLSISNYKLNYEHDKKNFSGIKEAPILKTNNNYYLILNWNYLSNKFYEGLIFDFYKTSGIKERFKRFPDFKNFVANHVTEKYIFRRCLKDMLNKKYAVLQFDEKETQGRPDAYFRSGNKIFLFEVKDAYFPSRAIGSYSYDEIKKAIDGKYNSSSKGTAQIVKQLNSLKEKPFEDDTYEKKKIKTRNLSIYPIMVYTDNFFGMPGINDYLQEDLSRKIQEDNLFMNFKSIKKLTFISLSFFMEYSNTLDHRDLATYLDQYQSYLNGRKKKFNANGEMEEMFKMNMNFEAYFYQNVDQKNKIQKSYLKNLFEILDLPNTYN